MWSLQIMSFNISPIASEYQEIHPYSAVNIDSVKINISLIMMREWGLHPSSRQCSCTYNTDLACFVISCKLYKGCVCLVKIGLCFVNILSIWWAVNSCFCIFSISTKEMVTFVLLVKNLSCIGFKHWRKVFISKSWQIPLQKKKECSLSWASRIPELE